MDDRKLLSKLKTDPNEGIRLLIGSYSALVFVILRGRLSSVCSHAEIEETASDVFAEFYTALPRFDENRGTVKAYLCRIATNIASEKYAEAMRRMGDVSLDADSTDRDAFRDDFSVEDEIIDREMRRELVEAVNSLGEPDREIIVRRFYLDQPSRSVAEALGMTVSAVDTRLHRAVSKLRDMLNRKWRIEK